MPSPDANGQVDILLSKIYATSDEDHHLQRVVYGVKLVGGIPHPIIERREANTGEVLETYLDGSQNS